MDMAATMVQKEIMIKRVFDAPLERVWKAWTDPDMFAKWWGPKDFTAPHVQMDFRVGGRYLYCMRGAGPDGVVRDYWGTGVYREIDPMRKIVYSDSFADEKGNVVPASHYDMPGEWPLELSVTVTFEARGGGTEMTLRHEGIPEGKMLQECEDGWNQSFDKLADSLK